MTKQSLLKRIYKSAIADMNAAYRNFQNKVIKHGRKKFTLKNVPVFMTFDNVESVDSLIGRLKHIKKEMKKQHG